MRVQIEGLAEMKKALTKKKVAVEKVASAVAKAGEKAEQTAKNLVPKDSGDLRDSIQHRFASGGKTILIEALAKNKKGVEYAQYVEFGTKKHGDAQPFMRPAQSLGKKVLIEECKKLVETK